MNNKLLRDTGLIIDKGTLQYIATSKLFINFPKDLP